MKFIYFDGKHINKDKIHYIEKGKVVVHGETLYRVYVYLDLGGVVDFFSEAFYNEKGADERYYGILEELNGK